MLKTEQLSSHHHHHHHHHFCHFGWPVRTLCPAWSMPVCQDWVFLYTPVRHLFLCCRRSFGMFSLCGLYRSSKCHCWLHTQQSGTLFCFVLFCFWQGFLGVTYVVRRGVCLLPTTHTDLACLGWWHMLGLCHWHTQWCDLRRDWERMRHK